MQHESDSDTNCNWCAWYSHQRFGTGTGGLGKKRMSGDHPNYSIIEIGQNTEKKPGDLRRLAVTRTPVKNHQLTLLWKILKRETYTNYLDIHSRFWNGIWYWKMFNAYNFISFKAKIEKEQNSIGNQRRNRDYPEYIIVKISESLRPEEIYCHLHTSERPTVKTRKRNLVNNNNNNNRDTNKLPNLGQTNCKTWK